MTDAGWLQRLGVACVILGALGWVWGFGAAQSPSSSWHLHGTPGAIELLATRAWITGLVCLVLGARVEGRSRALVLCATLGVLCALGAHAATAWTGWLGVQILDARDWARWILAARLSGAVLQGAALVLALRRGRREGAPGAAP